MIATCVSRTLLIGLVLMCVISCGGDDQSHAGDQERTLTVLYLEIWADSLNHEFHAVCDQWAKSSGTKVIVEDIPLKDLSSKLAAYVDAGEGADLAVFPAHLTILYSRKLADFSSLMGQVTEELGPSYEIAAMMNRVGDKWVGVPLFAWSHIWVYRDDLMRLEALRVPDTWDEAATVVRKLTDHKKGVWGLGIGLGEDDDAAMFFQSLLWAHGASVFAEDGQTVVLDSRETRDAVNWLLSLYRDGIIPEGALGWDGASNNRNFLGGTIAVTANSPTIYYAAKHSDTALAANIRHSVYPSGPAGRYSYATGFSLSLLKDSPNADRSLDLIRYIMRRDNYQRLIAAGEGSVNPMYKGVDALALWQHDEKLLPALQSLEIERPVGWPGPVTAAAAEVFEQRILTDMFARIIDDNLSTDDAVTEAASKVRAIVAKHRP